MLTIAQPLLLAGKLVGWGLVGTVHPGKLVHVTDSNSGASFLVDTGQHRQIISCFLPKICVIVV